MKSFNISFRQIIILAVLFMVLLLFFNWNTNRYDISIGLLDIPTPVSQEKITQNEKTKYVVYECVEGMLCGGLGDRFKGIYSAYGWSLVSGRKFIIHHPKPCSLTNMFLPNRIDWRGNMNDIIKDKKIDKIHKVDQSHMKDVCKNSKLDEFERNNTDIIVIRNNLDWLLGMSQNQNIKEKLIKLGYEPSKFTMPYLFKKWYEDLFKLHPRLEEKYNSFLKKAKPNQSSKLICAQIRIGGKREHVDYDELFTQKNNTIFYWNFIKEHISKANNDYMIFLTTDTKLVQEEAIKIFGDKIIMHDGINAHLDREHNLESDCSKLDKIFLDFHSLKDCDAAIISQSGFGMLGTWNRLNPSNNLAMFTKQQKLVVFNKTEELFIF